MFVRFFQRFFFYFIVASQFLSGSDNSYVLFVPRIFTFSNFSCRFYWDFCAFCFILSCSAKRMIPRMFANVKYLWATRVFDFFSLSLFARIFFVVLLSFPIPLELNFEWTVVEMIFLGLYWVLVVTKDNTDRFPFIYSVLKRLSHNLTILHWICVVAALSRNLANEMCSMDLVLFHLRFFFFSFSVCNVDVKRKKMKMPMTTKQWREDEKNGTRYGCARCAYKRQNASNQHKLL